METPVIFLDGELKGQLVFGIPNNPVYFRMKPPRIGGTCTCKACEFEGITPYIIEDEREEYHLISLGRGVRVAAIEKYKVEDRDRAAVWLTCLAYDMWQGSYSALRFENETEYNRQKVREFKASLKQAGQ